MSTRGQRVLQELQDTTAALRFIFAVAFVQRAHARKVMRYGPGAGMSTEEIVTAMSDANKAFVDVVLAQPRSSR